jgi:hypothetical protein
MASRRLQQITSEAWNGFWADARYYARRSDGACFAIDGATRMLDLAAASPASAHVRAVTALPQVGRFVLRVFATRPVEEARVEPSGTESEASAPGRARLFAYGVRRLA